ncbi:MAG: endonuclease III [Chitinophagaceae bacterium]
MTKSERYRYVIEYFLEHSPDPETELVYDGSYQLLVAVILSAQCTDKRVNLTTPAIFQRFPDVESLAASGIAEIYEYIRSISYPNNKSKHLVGMARMVMEKFNGIIPMTVEDLVQLPGVGRKTANVITSVIAHQPNMAVDTHVFRVSARLGLTKGGNTPLATEKELIKNLPEKYIYKAHHWLILHGRYVCLARNPKCSICGLRSICLFYRNIIRKEPNIHK